MKKLELTMVICDLLHSGELQGAAPGAWPRIAEACYTRYSWLPSFEQIAARAIAIGVLNEDHHQGPSDLEKANPGRPDAILSA